MFEVEIGGVRIIIEPQSWERPNGDMKVSSAPSFGAPGGHIFDVVAQGLKKHVFTAMPYGKEDPQIRKILRHFNSRRRF